MSDIFHEFANNVSHNLFKPLLLFFYMGFLIPILKVPFEFPKVIYQGITIYLLVAIGWHGGEELASLGTHEFMQAGGFMVIGFITNACIGVLAYLFLRAMTKLRRIDAATIGAYYGSDSAGTFVTCVGVLSGLALAQKALKDAGALAPYDDYTPAQYMPVMLAVMEIPGCLVGLAQIARLRHTGMDRWGNMPDEPGYMKGGDASPPAAHGHDDDSHEGHGAHGNARPVAAKRMHGEGATSTATATATAVVDDEGELSTQRRTAPAHKPEGFLNPKVLHEVFLNPGLY